MASFRPILKSFFLVDLNSHSPSPFSLYKGKYRTVAFNFGYLYSWLRFFPKPPIFTSVLFCFLSLLFSLKPENISSPYRLSFHKGKYVIIANLSWCLLSIQSSDPYIFYMYFYLLPLKFQKSQSLVISFQSLLR